MASQEFALGHWVGIIVVILVLFIVVMIIMAFMSFGQQQSMTKTRFSLNMKRSKDGQTEMQARDRGNTMIIHDSSEDGHDNDLDLTLRVNYKQRDGRRILIKNNTPSSVINLIPTEGVTFGGGQIEDALTVQAGVYCILLYTNKGTNLLRLQ
uniref:Uncharacterized protein n=1 Tax=Pithovirus LCPAC403 TaxID=2506596 RepID=A0A481ZDE7_9VIRU|nr:MAG: hypothetical protein LCPAC403_03040 [Pithovirus LCPAC403]